MQTLNDILALAKRRPWIAGLAILLLLAVVIVLIVCGVKLWHSLLALFGVGAASAPTLTKYARSDAQRQADQALIDQWKQREQAKIDQAHQQTTQADQRETAAKVAEIRAASQEETPEQLRKRLLNSVRKEGE